MKPIIEFHMKDGRCVTGSAPFPVLSVNTGIAFVVVKHEKLETDVKIQASGYFVINEKKSSPMGSVKTTTIAGIDLATGIGKGFIMNEKNIRSILVDIAKVPEATRGLSLKYA